VSVLHQQRIRVFHNSEGFFAPERDWEAVCPCCETLGLTSMFVAASWAEAMTWAFAHLKLHHCLFCIDGQMPAGTSDVLGELFERCPACHPACEMCDGLAVYPAKYENPTELVEDLLTVRLTVIFCDECAGVVAIVPLDPEVTV
jgi:hypothetical protein